MKRVLNPRILGLRLTMLLHICGRRLRLHTGQELLAGSGIAVGVALVFGVLFANTSLTGSAGRLIHQVVGSARLELAARSPLASTNAWPSPRKGSRECGRRQVCCART